MRGISKVADAYKLDKRRQRMFKPHGGVAYDDRVLKWYLDLQRVSIWSVGGRLNIPYATGPRQRELLQSQQGETDLCYIKGEFYLFATCNADEPTPEDIDGVLGVDLGVTNIAATSDGDIHTSATIERNRRKQQRLRTDLQKRGSLSAKRHLRKLAGRQSCFQADVNHCISKHIVQEAQRTNRAIGLEELTDIRARTRVRGKEQRAKRRNWAFAQLRAFLTYKACLAGIPVILVDPAYTSQRCYVCGHTERANRRSQAEFVCQACGYANHADYNASLNIAFLAWASVNTPIVSDAASVAAPETSSRF